MAVESKCGDITVTWTQSYSYFLYEPGTLEYGPNGGELSSEVSGCVVVDEDGDELTDGDIEGIIREFEEFTDFDRLGDGREMYEELYDTEELGEGTETETVYRDYRPDAVVHYDRYDCVSSRDYDDTKWEEVEFYGQENGLFVAWSYHSLWAKELPLYDGEMFTGEAYHEKAAEWIKSKVDKGFLDKALEALNDWQR